MLFLLFFVCVEPHQKWTYVNYLFQLFRSGNFIVDTRVAIFEREKQKAKMMTKAIKIVSKVWCKWHEMKSTEKLRHFSTVRKFLSFSRDVRHPSKSCDSIQIFKRERLIIKWNTLERVYHFLIFRCLWRLSSSSRKDEKTCAKPPNAIARCSSTINYLINYFVLI